MNYFNNYKTIKEEVSKLTNKTNLIIVTKNQSFEKILPFINNGHFHFGENKVQEAKLKWSNILNNNRDIREWVQIFYNKRFNNYFINYTNIEHLSKK